MAMKHVPILALWVVLLCRTATAATPPFDFAAAERNADIELKRKPETPQNIPKTPPVPPAVPTCALCKDTGRIVCPQHAKQVACVINGDPDACKLCRDLGYIPCPTCKANPKPEAKSRIADAEAALNLTFTAAQDLNKDVDADSGPDRLNTKMTGYVAEHLCLSSNLPRPAALACVQHGEAMLPKLERAFQGPVFSFTAPQNLKFYQVDKTTEYKRFLETIWTARFPGVDSTLFMKTSGTRAYQLPSTGVVCYEKLQRNQDLLVHDFIHMYSHILLNRVAGERIYVPWIEEGFAAYAETLELSAPRVYCIQYDFNKMDIQKNRAKVLLAMARANTPVPMAKLSQMSFMDMKEDEYFQSWSMITMLIERDPNKFITFLKVLPESVNGVAGGELKAVDQEKALQDAYGYDYPKLLSVWRQYVLATVR